MANVQKITPSLWFDMNAEEAMNYYCDVFPDSRINHIERYPDESLDEHFKGMSGKVINGQFTLSGVDFVCLDGGPVFKFNSPIFSGIICHERPNLSLHQPHSLSSPPLPTIAFQ